MKHDERASWLKQQSVLSVKVYGEPEIPVWGPAASVIGELYETLIKGKGDRNKDRVESFWEDNFFVLPGVPGPFTLHGVTGSSLTSPRSSVLAGARYPHVVAVARPTSKVTFPAGLVDKAEYWKDPASASFQDYLIYKGTMSQQECDALKASVSGKEFDQAADQIRQEAARGVRRLYTSSLLWLFYLEQTGLFRILGAILDDFASRGRWPLKIIDDSQKPYKPLPVAFVIEYLITLTKMGVSSTVRDRASSYRRCLGWTSEEARRLDISSEVNAEFSTNFHKFLQGALEYYKDKRLAYAIQATKADSKPSVATVKSIATTLELLRQSRERFLWGRNHTNTVWGLLWAIVALGLARELRHVFGATDSTEPSRYLAKIYQALGLGKEDEVLYTERLECAVSGRDLLLEMEFLDTKDSEQIEAWLNAAEDKVEGYRTAYQKITGVDLGVGGTPKIPQQV
jgi:hypothetical protein